jgi:predicted transcriptional regulator
MDINSFNEPTKHPFEMLDGYKHACEKESIMRIILTKCIEAGNLDETVTTKYSHPTMVDDGLLERVGKRRYRLTRKGKGLLYTVYGKE